MKITNYNLIKMINTLEGYVDKKLPQKISYAITCNFMEISKKYNTYDTQLKKIFNLYSEHIHKDKNGNIEVSSNGIPIVDEDVKSEFDEQITDLLNIEINVDMYYIEKNVFNYEDKGIYDALSANDIMILQSILCKPES